jgi:deoxyguanosine kinase
VLFYENIFLILSLFRLGMDVYLSLGSNLNDRLNNIRQALLYIDGEIGTLIKKSEVFRTESWGYSDSEYLNMCVLCDTDLDPQALLTALESIEKRIGRTLKTNDEKNIPVYQAREIDIDIVFYGQSVIKNSGIVVPHPKLHDRRFVLKPLDQIAPHFIHPVLLETVHALLQKCTDDSYVLPVDVDIIPF